MSKTQNNAKYELGKKIGSGAYGNVYNLKSKSKADFVLKKIDKTNLDIELGALREISILKMLQSQEGLYEGIVNLEDVVVGQDSVDLILPKYSIELSKAIQNNKITCKKPIVYQLLKTLLFLRENGIIHRDIKPDNIMLTNEMKPVLIDFSLAKMFDGLYSEGTHTGKVATVTYRAPEVVYKEPYSYPIDVWSMGIVFFELYTMSLIAVNSDLEMLDFIKKENRKFRKNSVGNLLNGMLKFDPEKRWTPKQALESSLFKGVPFLISQNNKELRMQKLPSERILKICDAFETTNPITPVAAQHYVDITGCNEFSAVAVASKFYETELRNYEEYTEYPEEELEIFQKMNYNLFVTN